MSWLSHSASSSSSFPRLQFIYVWGWGAALTMATTAAGILGWLGKEAEWGRGGSGGGLGQTRGCVPVIVGRHVQSAPTVSLGGLEERDGPSSQPGFS